MKIELKAGPMTLSLRSQKMIASSMYDKGRAFIVAAVLLGRQAGQTAVVLHLLCQGIEIILKALLLRRDFDGYKKKLVKLGHDVPRVLGAARSATGLHLFPGAAGLELAGVGKFYRDHLLRYASPFDIFVNPTSIPIDRLFRHCKALIKFLDQSKYFDVNT